MRYNLSLFWAFIHFNSLSHIISSGRDVFLTSGEMFEELGWYTRKRLERYSKMSSKASGTEFLVLFPFSKRYAETRQSRSLHPNLLIWKNVSPISYGIHEVCSFSQMNDVRSKLVQETIITITVLTEEMGSAFIPVAGKIFPDCLKRCSKTTVYTVYMLLTI